LSYLERPAMTRRHRLKTPVSVASAASDVPANIVFLLSFDYVVALIRFDIHE
jgi:hypothetical protein